jgi:Uma2 family endonuclease
MVTLSLSYLDAISRLPAGGTLILNDVPWEEYEQLLNDLGDDYGVRINYDQGRLEVMSPSTFHEMYKDLVFSMAFMLAYEFNTPFETRGSSTFKQARARKGAEPDTCFYIQNATRIVGKRRIDLSTDPPPDIVVEIDVSQESIRKLEFYAGLGVPEVWHYDERSARIYLLRDQSYVEVSSSQSFPVLTSKVLTQTLEQSKTEGGQMGAISSFREWLRGQQKS